MGSSFTYVFLNTLAVCAWLSPDALCKTTFASVRRQGCFTFTYIRAIPSMNICWYPKIAFTVIHKLSRTEHSQNLLQIVRESVVTIHECILHSSNCCMGGYWSLVKYVLAYALNQPDLQKTCK